MHSYLKRPTQVHGTKVLVTMPDDIDADTLVAPIGACRTLARFNSLKDPSRGVTEAGETTADDAYEDAQGVVRTGRVTGSAVVILPVTRALEAICNGCEKLVATIVELLSSGGDAADGAALTGSTFVVG